MMKMLKQLLVMVFVGLLTMSGMALGELGPPIGVGEGGEQQGDTDRARTGECKDFLGVMGIHDGPGCGDGNQHQNKGPRLEATEGNCGGGCDQNQYMYKGTK
jgi:hypothetical protein